MGDRDQATLFAAALQVAFADDQLEAHEQEALGGLVQVLGLDPSVTAAAAQEVRAAQASGTLEVLDAAERVRVSRELRALVRRSSATEASKQGALDGLWRLFGPEPIDQVPAPDGGGLRPLQCRACGAPVPLADAAHVKCGSCDAEVAIPPQYRSLRAARGHLSLAQGEAQEFLGVLGHSPGAVGHFLAYAHLPLLAVPIAFSVFLVATNFLVLGAVDVVGRLAFSLVPADVLSLRARTGIWVLSFFVSLPLPWLLSRFLRVREVTRLGLLEGLAAAPPTHPGGAFRCRKCAAPLAVEAGALGVVCDYCGVENVIRRDLEAFHEEHGGTLFAAETLQAARMNYSDRTGTAWVKALGVAGVFAIALAFVVLIVPEMAWRTFPGIWHEEVNRHNRHLAAAWSGWDEWGDLRTAAGNGIVIPEERAPNSPATRQVWLEYFVPLRAGEQLSLHYSGLRVRMPKKLPPGKARELTVRFGELRSSAASQEGRARPGAPAVFSTPVSGWFRLELKQSELEPGLEVWTSIR